MGVGGVEKSLVGLINSLPEKDFDITIIVTQNDMRLASDIKRRADIRLSPLYSRSVGDAFLSCVRRFDIRSAMSILKLKLTEKKAGNERNREVLNSFTEQAPKERFDAAIAYYLPDTDEIPFCLNCVNAKKKIVWEHMDVEKYAPRMPFMEQFYKRFERVYCVSEDVKNKFGVIFPNLKNRTKVFHNIIDRDDIIKKSTEYVAKTKGAAIFTCARVSWEKQPMMCAEALKKLVDDGVDAYWYWAGGDTNECLEALEEKLKELNLEDRFIRLGTLINPYPYYCACDVYAQPSLHESYCISVAEAKILCGRIVCTNFPAAYESLTPSPACKIVGQNAEALAEGIKEALSSPREQFKTTEQNGELEEFMQYIRDEKK